MDFNEAVENCPFLIPFHVFSRKYELALNTSLLLLNQFILFHEKVYEIVVTENSICDLNHIHQKKFPLCEPIVVEMTYYARSCLFDIFPDVRQLCKYYMTFADSELTISFREAGLSLLKKALQYLFALNQVFVTLYWFRHYMRFFESVLPFTVDLFDEMTMEQVNSKQLHDILFEIKQFYVELCIVEPNFHDPRLIRALSNGIPCRSQIVDTFEIAQRRIIKHNVRMRENPWTIHATSIDRFPPNGVLVSNFPSLAPDHSWANT